MADLRGRKVPSLSEPENSASDTENTVLKPSENLYLECKATKKKINYFRGLSLTESLISYWRNIIALHCWQSCRSSNSTKLQ